MAERVATERPNARSALPPPHTSTRAMGKRTRDKAKAEVEDDDDDVDASAFPRGGAASGGRGDEDAFPRGGGGGGDGDDAGRGRKRRSSQRGGDGDGSNDDDDDPFSRISRAAKGASSRAVSSSGGGAKYVETLKYKSLRPGAKLLGIISEVTARGLVMSLPDGLRGTVARAEVAGTFGSSRRNRTAAADGSESSEEEYSSDDDDDDDDAEASLELLYEPGQVLRCAVVSLEKGKTGGKRIELSLRLEKVCEGLTKESLTEGSVAPAVVQSVEDHGYILSFGIADTSGFLPKKNVASDLGEIRKGRIIDVVITGAPKGNKGYFTVTSDQKRIKTSVAHETSATNVDTLLPGMLVNSRIKQILSDGVSVSFMTYFSGTVDCFHTGALATSKGVSSAFKVGQRMRARIIFVDSASKRVSLTLLPHLLDYASIELPKLGKTFQTAKIERVDAGQGVALSISDGKNDIAGYAHVSQLSDERVEKVEKKFKIGRSVSVRVIGHRLLDGVVSVSLKSSVMAQPFFSLDELTPGMLVNGEVLAVEHYGAIVKLAEGIKALCPPLHISDIVGRTTSAKVAPGAKLKFRVLNVDRNSRRATVSHKRTLIKSELPVIGQIEDAVPGSITHGVVTGVNEYGVFVSLYGDLKGLAGLNDLGLLRDQKPSDAFGVGQVVRVQVVSADTSGRLRLSLASGDADGNSASMIINASADALKPGHVVEKAVVTHVASGTGNVEVVFSMEEGNIPGVVPLAHLSDHPLTAQGLSAVLNPGDEIGPLVVLEGKSTRAVMSRKLSLVESSREGKLPATAKEATLGAVFPGYVASATAAGVFVRFLGRLTGLAPPSQLTDGTTGDVHEMFPVGKTVNALILSVDTSTPTPRLSLSLKVSATSSPLSDAPLVRSFFQDIEFLDDRDVGAEDVGISPETAKSLKPGTWMDVSVNETKDYGVLMDVPIDSNVVGLVTPHQIPVDTTFTAGDEVKGYVLDVSRREGVVDIGMRDGLGKFKRNKTSSGKSLKKLKVGDQVSAEVELIKAEYVALSLPEHNGLIGFAPVHHLNLRYEDASERFTPTQCVKAVIAQLPEGEMGRLLLTVPVTKGTTASGRIAAGTLVKGVVSEVQNLQALVALPNNARGRLYISEFSPGEDTPLESISVGSTVEATVMGLAGDRGGLLDLSMHRKSAFVLEDVSVGDDVSAYVVSVTDDGIKVTIAPGITSFIPKIETSDKSSELAMKLSSRFTVGERVSAIIVGVKATKKRVDLSLRTDGASGSSRVCVGAKVQGIITRVVENVGLMVQLGSHSVGRVHLTDMADEYDDDPCAKYEAGQVVQVRVLNASSNGELDLSMRASRLSSKRTSPTDPEITDISNLVPGQRVKGYVKATSKKGCFIALSRGIDAMCKLSNLADSFIADPAKTFPPGKLVEGRIVSADAAKGRVELAFRETDATQGNADVSTVKVGDVLIGTVRRVQPYGVFVSLDGTKLSGLCHISMFADARISDDLASHVRQGERVRTKVLEINTETNKISLGIKASLFEDEDGDGDEEMADVNTAHTLDPLMDVDGENDGEDDDNDGESSDDEDDDDDDGSSDEANASESTEASSEEGEEEEEEEEEESSESGESDSDIDEDGPLHADEGESTDEESDPSDSEDAPIGKDLGFDWDAEKTDASMTDVADEKAGKKGADKAPSKREKKRLKEARELEILQKEQEMRDGDHIPESAMEFEKLLIASPRSSFLWVRYMAFHVSCGAYDEAKEVAERALGAIPASEEAERMNVWAAYLNLENKYGTPSPEEAVKKLFTRAVQIADAKHMHLTLVSMYERNAQEDALEESLKKAAKKFSYSAKIWLAYIRSAVLKNDSEKARKLLDRATQSLPKHKHIKILTRTALLEMKEGNPERGRTMFEGILRNYPRRTDIWSVYIDQEIKQGDIQRIRALFERATHLDLNAKSMKFLFKRYLDFERSEGDDERIAHVKQRAMEYVSNKFGSAAE